MFPIPVSLVFYGTLHNKHNCHSLQLLSHTKRNKMENVLESLILLKPPIYVKSLNVKIQ